MSGLKEKLVGFKGKSKEQFNQFILENSTKSVLKELSNNGIDPAEVSQDEMDEMIAEEVKTQREFAKGLATGAAGITILLELLG